MSIYPNTNPNINTQEDSTMTTFHNEIIAEPTDVVTRLRRATPYGLADASVLSDAAAEIERLQSELAKRESMSEGWRTRHRDAAARLETVVAHYCDTGRRLHAGYSIDNEALHHFLCVFDGFESWLPRTYKATLAFEGTVEVTFTVETGNEDDIAEKIAEQLTLNVTAATDGVCIDGMEDISIASDPDVCEVGVDSCELD